MVDQSIINNAPEGTTHYIKVGWPFAKCQYFIMHDHIPFTYFIWLGKKHGWSEKIEGRPISNNKIIKLGDQNK